jgi:transposase
MLTRLNDLIKTGAIKGYAGDFVLYGIDDTHAIRIKNHLLEGIPGRHPQGEQEYQDPIKPAHRWELEKADQTCFDEYRDGIPEETFSICQGPHHKQAKYSSWIRQWYKRHAKELEPLHETTDPQEEEPLDPAAVWIVYDPDGEPHAQTITT